MRWGKRQNCKASFELTLGMFSPWRRRCRMEFSTNPGLGRCGHMMDSEGSSLRSAVGERASPVSGAESVGFFFYPPLTQPVCFAFLWGFFFSFQSESHRGNATTLASELTSHMTTRVALSVDDCEFRFFFSYDRSTNNPTLFHMKAMSQSPEMIQD